MSYTCFSNSNRIRFISKESNTNKKGHLSDAPFLLVVLRSQVSKIFEGIMVEIGKWAETLNM